MSYKAVARLAIVNEDPEVPGVLGHGVVLLLEGVEREHSLNRAAKSLGMAYSKAWRKVKEAEALLGCELLDRDGARGSTLTPEGVRAVAVYNSLQKTINEVIARKMPQLLGELEKGAAETAGE